jgi:hypothetical protein
MTTRDGWTRRAFLGGAGAALALPFLESLAPRAAQAQAAQAPQRLLVYYVPNGIHMPAWTPAQEGADWALSPILSPLAAVKDKLLVLSGLSNEPARPDGAGDHAAGTGAFLTATHVNKTEGEDIRNGVSMDQLAAAKLAEQTRFASLQLGIDGGGSVGNCDSGYSCAYVRNISWSGPQTPLAKLVNPRVVFDRLFAGLDQRLTQAERDKRARYRKSVLDLVMSDAQRLSPRLGQRDRAKLDEYMTSVREVELRIDAATGGLACQPPDAPPPALEYPEHVAIMTDLMVLALQCDLTRVITFMLGNAGSTRPYPFLGVNGAHHELSHHQNNPDNFEQLTRIATWEITQLAALLEKMDRVQEAQGRSLLDNSLVLFSSEISDGNSHSHDDLPVLLAGSQGGRLRTNRHLRYQRREPIADLFLSILDGYGVSLDTFGDNGAGPLHSLT